MNTYISTFSPGFSLDLGSYWTFRYTANWETHSNPAFENELGQSADLTGAFVIRDWNFQFSQLYDSSTEALVETARLTDREIVQTSFGASHAFDNRFSFETTIAQTFRLVEQFTDSYDWSTQQWANYEFSRRLSAGIGFRSGYTDLNPGAYMTYFGPQARVSWKPTDKITLSATSGRERRRLYAGGSAPIDNPIYSASLRLKPFVNTSVTYQIDRSVNSSYYTNQVNVANGWRISASQRLFRHFTLSGDFGKQRRSYVGIQNGVNTGREDASDTYNVRLKTTFLRRGSISALYQGIDTSSNERAFDLSSTQIGVEIGFQY